MRMPSDFPEHIRSTVHGIVRVYLRFRIISVHSFSGFSFLSAGKLKRNSTVMAGTTKDMSLASKVTEIYCMAAKNGADCYSKNGDAVTVLTWQS